MEESARCLWKNFLDSATRKYPPELGHYTSSCLGILQAIVLKRKIRADNSGIACLRSTGCFHNAGLTVIAVLLHQWLENIFCRKRTGLHQANTYIIEEPSNWILMNSKIIPHSEEEEAHWTLVLPSDKSITTWFLQIYTFSMLTSASYSTNAYTKALSRLYHYYTLLISAIIFHLNDQHPNHSLSLSLSTAPVARGSCTSPQLH